MPSAIRYTPVARALHWLIAALIVAQFVLANMAEEAADAKSAQLALYANHKSIGMLVLMLAVLRLGWRLLAPPPALPAQMSRWQRLAAQATHWILYALIFALPLSGWLYSSASAYSVSFFNLFTWPDLVEPAKLLEERLKDLHHLFAESLFVVAALHLAAALKHGLWDRDGVLGRMSNWSWTVAWLLLAAVLIYVLGVRFLPAAPTPQAAQPAAVAVGSEGAQSGPQQAAHMAMGGVLPGWQIDYPASYIEFVGEQAGAPFRGRWQRFEADVHFAADQLQDSAARVVIDTASNSTQDDERDAVMRDPDWFDTAQFPEAVFLVNNFQPVAGAPGTFLADGSLRIRDVERPIVLEFVIAADPPGAAGDTAVTLTGRTRIDRLAFKLGDGEWLDTTWVGQYVDVNVRLRTQS